MRTLTDTTFESERLPDGWTQGRGAVSFEDGRLRSDRVTHLTLPLPGHGFRKLRVEITARRGNGLAITCGEKRAAAQVNVENGYHCLRTYESATIAENIHPVEAKDGPYVITFTFESGEFTASIDGVEVLRGKQPSLTALCRRLSLSFWQETIVERVRIEGDDELTAPLFTYPARGRDSFETEVTVDFMDDMHYEPFTPVMFEQLFDIYQQWGINRVHWIYKGGTQRGMWDSIHANVSDHFQQTIQNIGSELFPYVVKLAHDRGIELYGLFKTFELAHMLVSVADGTDYAKEHGKLNRVGGWIFWASHVVREHRELIMSRKPGAFGPPESDHVTRIELVKEDDRDAAFTASDLVIYTSEDNHTYRRYEGPIERHESVENRPIWEHTGSGGRPTAQTRRCRVMCLTGLDIRAPYMVVTTPTRTGSFANTLVNLVHVYDGDKEIRRVTYGIKQRVAKVSYDIHSATASRGDGYDFENSGIEFDVLPGSPSACLAGYDVIRERYIFDGRDGVIGIALGKEETTVGCMSPAFDETRSFWLEWVRDILDHGADGVDLRFRHHHSHLTWGEFGFEKPVRDVFLERHGVDIWETDDFDRAALRRLRGEHYTQFYREAKTLIASRGRLLRLHVSSTMDVEPEFGGAMDMHFDWRTWIDEGLADSVTMKEVFPETTFADEILSHTRPRNTPVIFSPFANNIWKDGRGAEITADRIRRAREGGYDGFQYYESCAIMRADGKGNVKPVDPALADIFKNAAAQYA